MEGNQPYGVEGPCVTPVQKHAHHPGLLVRNLCVDHQPRFLPGSPSQASQCCGHPAVYLLAHLFMKGYWRQWDQGT